MLEIIEDRYGRGATLTTSQIPVDRWPDLTANRHSLTPSSTGSLTTPIAYSSGATVYANKRS